MDQTDGQRPITRSLWRLSRLLPACARCSFLCAKTSSTPPAIAALVFASKGGTAWQNKNGVWICAQDARGKPIHDYRPKSYSQLYQPSLPLTKGVNGRYKVIHK